MLSCVLEVKGLTLNSAKGHLTHPQYKARRGSHPATGNTELKSEHLGSEKIFCAK